MASFIRKEITTCSPDYTRLQSSTNQREREGGGSKSTPGADVAQRAQSSQFLPVYRQEDWGTELWH